MPTVRRPWAQYAFIVLVYTLTHGLSLLNRGIFWDDWIFWQQDKSVVAEAGKALGSTWPSAINDLFYYSQVGLTFNRVVAFAALLLVAIIIFDVLRRLPRVGENAAMWVAVVFSVFPVYQSRIALVMVGYGISLALFALGVWLLVRFGPRPGVIVQLVAAALFVASFQTASLLVLFYAMVPALLLMLDPPEPRDIRGVSMKFMRYAGLMIVPVSYWVVRRVWFAPSGLYSDYNTISRGFAGVAANIVTGITNSVVYSLIETIPGATTEGLVHPGFRVILAMSIIMGALVLIGLWRYPMKQGVEDTWFRHSGAILVVAAVAPYVLVGKIPSNVAWETRHQLLVPIGAALLLVGIVKSHMRDSRVGRAFMSVILAGIVALSGADHVNSYIRYERDWLKQQAFMVHLGSDPRLSRSTYTIVRDKTAYLNESRWYGYQYTGMAAEVFGDQTRLIHPYAANVNWYAYANVNFYFAGKRYYKTGDYKFASPQYVVTVKPGKLDLRSGTTVLRLMILDWTDRDALRATLKDALVFEVHPYTIDAK